MQDKVEKNWMVTDLTRKHRFFYHKEEEALNKVQGLKQSGMLSEMKEYTNENNIADKAVYNKKTGLIRDLDYSKPHESNPQAFIMLQPIDSGYDLLPGKTFTVL